MLLAREHRRCSLPRLQWGHSNNKGHELGDELVDISAQGRPILRVQSL